MRSLGLLLVATALVGCGGDTDPSGKTRTFRMGFSAIPPRQDLVLQNLELWSQRADAAILHVSVPYAKLLAGMSPSSIIAGDIQAVVNYHRGKHQEIAITLDLTDGLNRAAEAPELVSLGRSLTEPIVQQRVTEFALAVSSQIHPAWLGLAAETNLIRAVAPAALYSAVRNTANVTAAALRTANTTSDLFVSVQVEVAWGWVTPAHAYVGIAQDLQDFPFAELLGLSSYPYFVYSDPSAIPADYYSRIRTEAAKPVMVVEGGWTSRNVGQIVSTEAVQRNYLVRQAALLDRAGALLVVQLTFADFDVAALPPPVPENLGPFVYLGLVNASLQPKPALAAWDSVFHIPLKQ